METQTVLKLEAGLTAATETVLAAGLAYDAAEQDKGSGRWLLVARWADYLEALSVYARAYAAYMDTQTRPLPPKPDYAPGSAPTMASDKPAGFDVSRETCFDLPALLSTIRTSLATPDTETVPTVHPGCFGLEPHACQGTGWDKELDSPSYCLCACHGADWPELWRA